MTGELVPVERPASPLYRLPQVRAAVDRGETVYIVESEKDVHRLEQEGLVATRNPGGAGKWETAYTKQLVDAYEFVIPDCVAEIVVIADHYDLGIEHARAVAAELVRYGPLSPRALLVPPTPGHDISDHLGDGRTLDDLVPVYELEFDEWERAEEERA